VNGSRLSDLWSELGKRLADRWLSLLVLPGVLYLAVAAAGHILGDQYPFDVELLARKITAEAKDPVAASSGGQIVLLVVVLVAGAAAGVAAQGIGVIVERAALASGWTQWPASATAVVCRWVAFRQLRWDRLHRRYADELELALLPGPAARQAAAGRRARISVERPERPTWTGDRIQAAVLRMDRDHRIDLAVVWPYLERVIPDVLRSDISDARAAVSRAAALAGWAVLYALLTWWWWPAAPLALVIAAAGRYRIRAGADAYARLLETAARLHVPALAAQLGIPHTGPLDQDLGAAITQHLQTTLPSPDIIDQRRERRWTLWPKSGSSKRI
jgi:hypothetical protein